MNFDENELYDVRSGLKKIKIITFLTTAVREHHSFILFCEGVTTFDIIEVIKSIQVGIVTMGANYRLFSDRLN